MASIRDVLGILFGTFLVGFSIGNAGLGKVAPYFIDGAENTKMIVTRMFEPHCMIPLIEEQLANGVIRALDAMQSTKAIQARPYRPRQ